MAKNRYEDIYDYYGVNGAISAKKKKVLQKKLSTL